MKIELDSLLEEIRSWKTLLKSKDEEVESLHGQLKFVQQQNKTLEETQSTLLQEIRQFNAALSTLHNSISKLEKHEVEKKALQSEKDNFKTLMDEQKLLHHKEIKELEHKISSIQIAHQEEFERFKSESLHNASVKVEKYVERINEKENIIRELEENISKLKNENVTETLRIKLEYEEKISKLKVRLAKPKNFNSLNNDVFRQKFVKIEKESKEEILNLKNEIKELYAQINSMKSSALSPNLQNYVSNEVREENITSGIHKEESSYIYKRLKTCATDENDFHAFGMGNNHVEAVKPVKKKLFNIDMNYFVK